mgnify:CR=1 FL=1
MEQTTLNLDMIAAQACIESSLIDATNNYKLCSNAHLDALDDLMKYYVNEELYELAQSVKQFKIDLVTKSGFLN